MINGIRQILAFLLYPPALLLAGSSMVCGTLFLHEDPLGMLALATICGALFGFVALQSVTRNRACRLADERTTLASELDRQRGLLEVLPAMVWQCDPAGRRSYVNPYYLGITGQRESDALGTGWLEAVHPDDRELCQGALRLAAVDRKPFELEYRLDGDDGAGERWVLDRGVPRYDASGTFSGFVVVSVDVTDWKREGDEEDASRRLLGLHGSINARLLDVLEKYDTLEEQRQNTAYSDRVKRDFLVALSDDLRGPVEDLHHISQLLDREELPERFGSYLKRMHESSEALMGLLGNAVRLRNLDQVEEEPEPGRFNLRRLVDQVVDKKRADADEAGLRVSVTMGDFVPTLVKSDPVRVRRMVSELWDTALRLAKSGRVSFRVTRESKALAMSRVLFAITHTSDDLDGDLVDRANYPADGIEGEPTGLGFGVCQQVAELLDGSAGVTRDEKNAVTFWVNLEVEELTPHWRGRRTHGRLEIEAVRCSAGTLLDLSLGGMRVQMTRCPADTVDLTLSDDEENIDLRAMVAWTKRAGFGKHEVGLQFIDVTADQATRLGRLATRNRIRQVFEAA